MAGKKSRKGKGTYAVYKAESRLQKNRTKRLERHLKKHPNDAQTAAAAKKPVTPRAAPSKRGNYPESKTRVVLDRAGHVYTIPSEEIYGKPINRTNGKRAKG